MAFGQPLLDSPLTQSRITNARIALDAAHMLVLRAAQYMDRAAELVERQRAGDRRDDAALAAAVKAARAEAASAVSAAKVLTPRTVLGILDDAIQVRHSAHSTSKLAFLMYHSTLALVNLNSYYTCNCCVSRSSEHLRLSIRLSPLLPIPLKYKT